MYQRTVSRADVALLLGSVLLTIVFALLILKWFAPHLLQPRSDLTLVQSDERVPPFYENIFRSENWTSKEYLIPDPAVKVRAMPLFPDMGTMGPNDMLGFRNLAVPNQADIVIIGDSQTYGNNAMMWESWPYAILAAMPTGTSLYSMATGGWSALQYYYAFLKTPVFSPKVVVIAFYTGNDPLETFALAIASPLWQEFLPERDISRLEPPTVDYPAPPEQQWAVTFPDRVTTVFTPKLRHGSNMDHPVVDAGWEIMRNVASGIARQAKEQNVNVVFTIIPTKEFAYAKKVKQSGLDPHPDYAALIADEGRRIDEFSRHLASLEGTAYVDVVSALQTAAMDNRQIYPINVDGHPLAGGYAVIAKTIMPSLRDYSSEMTSGFYLGTTDLNHRRLIYVEDGRYWFVIGGEESIAADSYASVSTSRLGSMVFSGYLPIADAPEMP